MTQYFKGATLALILTAAFASGCGEAQSGFVQFLQEENAAIQKVLDKPSGVTRYPGSVATVIREYKKKQAKEKRGAPPYVDRQESEVFDSEYLKKLEKATKSAR